MTTTTKTPGYNVRLEIKFSIDKNGKRRAYYWSTRQMRMFPIALDKAEMFIATGAADLLEANPFATR